MESWKKALLCVGGAASVAGVLYYLLREEEGSTLSPELIESSDSKKKLRIEEVTKEQVQQILSDIVQSQEKMKVHIKEITQELMAKPMPVIETYNRIKAVQPEEILDKFGINTFEFDHLLSKHQHDPQIREGIAKVMGMPDPATMAANASKAASVTAKKVVEAHAYMLEELTKVLQDFDKLPNKASLEPKVIVQAAQAVVAARLEEKLGLTSDDMEAAMMMHQQSLATDQEFAAVSTKMQMLMQPLMGMEG